MNERDVILELTDVQPGFTYTIIPTTYESGIVRSFTLKAYSKNPVELKPLDRDTSIGKSKPATGGKVDSNSPIPSKSRAKPIADSPKGHLSSGDDIEANNSGLAGAAAMSPSNAAAATTTAVELDEGNKKSSNGNSSFHEIDLGDEAESHDTNGNSNCNSTDNSDEESQFDVEERS